MPRIEDSKLYKRELDKALDEAGLHQHYRRDTRINKPQDVNIIVDNSSIPTDIINKSPFPEINFNTKTGKVRRSIHKPFIKSLSGENSYTYLALMGLLIFGLGIATHGIGLGALHFILEEVNRHGITHTAFRIIQSSSGVKQLEVGLATSVSSGAGIVVTRSLEK